MTTATPSKPKSPTFEELQPALDAILTTLGEPVTQPQQQAMKAYQAGDANTLRVLAATHLGDSYLRCLGYLASVPKMPPTVAVLLAEAGRAASDHARDSAMVSIGGVIANCFGAESKGTALNGIAA